MTVLGSSDLDVFPLGLGGNTFGWTSDKDTSFAVLDAYVAGGGNFIDTADSYSAWVPGNSGGESETIIGEWTAARGNRDAVIIATKVSRHPEFRGLARGNVLAAADATGRRAARFRPDGGPAAGAARVGRSRPERGRDGDPRQGFGRVVSAHQPGVETPRAAEWPLTEDGG